MDAKQLGDALDSVFNPPNPWVVFLERVEKGAMEAGIPYRFDPVTGLLHLGGLTITRGWVDGRSVSGAVWAADEALRTSGARADERAQLLQGVQLRASLRRAREASWASAVGPQEQCIDPATGWAWSLSLAGLTVRVPWMDAAGNPGHWLITERVGAAWLWEWCPDERVGHTAEETIYLVEGQAPFVKGDVVSWQGARSAGVQGVVNRILEDGRVEVAWPDRSAAESRGYPVKAVQLRLVRPAKGEG